MTTKNLNELLNTFYIPQISIDFYKNNYTCVPSKQLDTARYLIITLTEHGKPRKIATQERALFRAGKPDNTYIYNEEECDILEDGRLLLKLTEQTLAAKGKIEADIQLITADNKIYSTRKFYIEADSLPYDESSVESSNEFNALNKLVSEESDRVETLKELEETATANEAIRQGQEEIREANEGNRITAETERETDTNTAVANANTATSNAALAATNAASATEAAAHAAANAAQAAQTANTAVEEMRSLIADDNILHTNTLGAPNGVATLDEEGFLSKSQIPDRTIEIIYGELLEDGTFINTDGIEVIGGINKQYIDVQKSIPYLWSGSEFLAAGSKLGLGTTSSSAFPGDRGLALEERAAALETFHNNLSADKVKYDNTGTSLLGANVQDVITELTAVATTAQPGRLSPEDKARIDNYANIKELAITLSAARWMGTQPPYTQTVSVENISAYNNGCVTLCPDASPLQESQIIAADITDIQYNQTSGLTFTASGERPTVDIPLILNIGTSMNCVEIPKYLGTYGSAKEISFDNTGTGLSGQTVQDIGVELKNSLYAHSTNNTLHITSAERTGWNNKASTASATTSSNGLMTAAMVTKLNGIAVGANAYTLPTASSSTLGGVKTTSMVTSTNGLTPTPIIGGVPYYKDTTYSLSNFGLTAAAAELNHCDGVTGNIQTQLNGKAAITHYHDDRYYTEAEVNNLLAKKNNSFVFESFTAPAQTIAASGTATFTVSISKTGYKPIMVHLYDTGSYNSYCYNCVISGSNAIIKLKNVATGSSISASPKFTVMYQLL